MTDHAIIIDPEFRDRIFPLDNDSFSGLEEDLLRDGCIDPLVVWAGKNLLLDGHHRKALCEQHNLSYGVHYICLSDRDEALAWIDRRQANRRNLTPRQMSVVRGRIYNRHKKQHGGDRRSDGSSGQIVHLKSATVVAKDHGVDERTIRRDGHFAEAVEKLGLKSEDIEDITIPRDTVIEIVRKLGDSPTTEQLQCARNTVTKPHVANNSGDNEWHAALSLS